MPFSCRCSLAVTIIVFFISSALSQDADEENLPLTACRVNETASGEDKTCKFPFILNGTRLDCIHFPFLNHVLCCKYFRHTKCTDQEDPDGLLWCSTRTTHDDFHVGNGGFWGYCDDECVVESELEEVWVVLKRRTTTQTYSI